MVIARFNFGRPVRNTVSYPSRSHVVLYPVGPGVMRADEVEVHHSHNTIPDTYTARDIPHRPRRCKCEERSVQLIRPPRDPSIFACTPLEESQQSKHDWISVTNSIHPFHPAPAQSPADILIMPYPFAGPSHYDPSNDSTHPYRPKRPRSPSPPSPGFGTLASPLEDVLLKRRRRDDNYGYFSFDSPAGEAGSISEGGVHGQNGHGDEGGSGHAGPCRVDMAAGVERRRNRLWAARNAPSSQPESGSSTASHVHPNDAYGGYSEARQDQSPDAPYTAPRPSQRPREASNSYGGDGIASSSRNSGHVMSSSPIRHEPPGSSPFKSSEPSTSQAIQHSNVPVSDSSGTIRASQRHRIGIFSDRECTEIGNTWQGAGRGEGYSGQHIQQDDAMGDEVDMEELEKEWGEYRGANSLLYELVCPAWPLSLACTAQSCCLAHQAIADQSSTEHAQPHRRHETVLQILHFTATPLTHRTTTVNHTFPSNIRL